MTFGEATAITIRNWKLGFGATDFAMRAIYPDGHRDFVKPIGGWERERAVEPLIPEATL